MWAGPKPLEFSPWAAASSSDPGATGPPSIAEIRGPVVPVAGKGDQNGKTIPAIAVIPATQQPQLSQPQPQPQPLPQPMPQPQPQPHPIPQPQPSEPLPQPQPLDPKNQPEPGKLPMDPMGKEPLPYPGGTGDPAADYLRALESGQVGFRIKVDQAIQLGLINAREFQDRREDLYLTALQVTQRRFDFATLAFFTEQAVRQSTGRELPNGGERWTLNTTGGFSKLFPTGALLVFQIANQVLVDLSGDTPTTAVSNLSLNLVQPFLQGGGYAVTLEPLTNSERTMVYAMRSYARFRKLFYVAIVGGSAAGGGYTNNPYGLQGLSPNLGRGIGGNLTAATAGYLPLLQQLATINNQRKNVAALEGLLKFYQVSRDGGQQSELQVGQVELQLLNSRGQLLGQAGGGGGSGIRGYLDTLDNFKLQLGLPVTVALELDDTPLKPIREQLARFEEVYAQARALALESAKYDPATPVGQFRARWLTFFTKSPLVRGTPFAKTIGERWDSWSPAKLTEAQVDARLGALREERRKLLAEKTDRQAKGLPEPEAEVRRLLRLNSDIDLGEFEKKVRAYEAQPWLKLMAPAAREAAQAAAFRDAFNAFYLVILEARNERLAMVRNQWPDLPQLPVAGVDVLDSSLDDAYTAGIQTALTNRLDLMNARGQVVDSWRQIAVTANSLQGVFDVRYDLSSTTPPGGNDIVGFSADRSRHQLTFNAELPLVRRAERNNYRAALVAYQRQRRNLMAFEDNIANDVRADLRQLRTIAELYLIQQRQVELNYSQVDNAQALLLAPPVPGEQPNAGNAAALTRQLLDAQSGLLNAQNQLYQLWVAYLNARMTLYLDLEQMTIDERGVWCDEFSDRPNNPTQPPPEPGRQPGERLHAPTPVWTGVGGAGTDR